MTLKEAYREACFEAWSVPKPPGVHSSSGLADEYYGRSDAKQAQDAITASLALLDSPTPGMTVRLETGEVYEILENGWVRARWAPGGGDLTWARLPTILPLLKAAVAGGAVVSVPESGGEG